MTGSVSSSFEAGDLDDELHAAGVTVSRTSRSDAHGERDAHPAARRRSRASAAQLARDPDVGAGWPRSSSRSLCAALRCVGFFVYPTYPNYDSYYALLWGREAAARHRRSSRASACRPSTRWRSSSARCCPCSARSADRAVDRADARLVPGAGRRGSTGSGARASRRSIGAHRRAAAAHALRLRVPRRARLHRRPVHGAGGLGGGAGGGAAAARLAGLAPARRSPACCGPRRGC